MLPAFLVVAAVTFNFLLAIVNANVTPLTPAAVVACEVALMFAIHSYAILNARTAMAAWYLLLGLFLVFFFLRTLVTGSMEPKYVRDVAIIPTFIVLGLTCDEKLLDRTVLTILVIVSLVGVVEAFFPTFYANVVNVKDFYISTRGFAESDFYNADSTLFVSATRPEERLFNFIDIPRMSSIFLEPVSLGNYCTIMAGYLCSRIRQLGRGTFVAGIVMILFLLVGCDGRLATASVVLIVGVTILAPYLPPFSAALYLPLALICGLLVVLIANPDSQADDFPGRIAHSIYTLNQFELLDWLGLSDDYIAPAMDSGIAYLITTQSFLGVALIWLFIASIGKQRTISHVKFTHAVLLYFALTMMVSYSMLTIKTAALAWFIEGVLSRSRSAGKHRVGRSYSQKAALARLGFGGFSKAIVPYNEQHTLFRRTFNSQQRSYR